MNGFVRHLPNLAVGRTGHGCGSYVDEDQNVVLIAVGGWSTSLHNTERHVIGQAAWTLLGPTTYKDGTETATWVSNGISVVSIDNELIATGISPILQSIQSMMYQNSIGGKRATDDLNKIFKFNKDTGDWKFIGTTLLKRSYHSSSVVRMRTKCKSILFWIKNII